MSLEGSALITAPPKRSRSFFLRSAEDETWFWAPRRALLSLSRGLGHDYAVFQARGKADNPGWSPFCLATLRPPRSPLPLQIMGRLNMSGEGGRESCFRVKRKCYCCTEMNKKVGMFSHILDWQGFHATQGRFISDLQL